LKLGLASRSGDDLGMADAVAVPCDVRDAVQLEKIVAATVDVFGRLDILVPNAGVGAYRPFLDLAPDFLEEMIDVNRVPPDDGVVMGVGPRGALSVETLPLPAAAAPRRATRQGAAPGRSPGG